MQKAPEKKIKKLAEDASTFAKISHIFSVKTLGAGATPAAAAASSNGSQQQPQLEATLHEEEAAHRAEETGRRHIDH